MSDSASGRPSPQVTIHTQGRSIEVEYQWIPAGHEQADLIVFLHEGLGSISMWRDWPARLCAATGCRGLVYSRYGYGQSTPRPQDEARGMDYLHRQAGEDLPALLKALGLEDERPILFGHSDGASIALLHAALLPGIAKAIIVAAPHIFVEEVTLAGIREAKEVYANTDLRARLARHHRDVDSVFSSWVDTWLMPRFSQWNIEALLPRIKCPVLAMQGEGDEYGTMEQIRGIARLVPQTTLLEIPDCGHTPQRDQPEVVLRAVSRFLEQLRSA